MGRIFRWTEQFQHFVEEVKESFWGCVRADEAGLEGVFRGGITAGARPVCGDGELRAREKRRSYRNGFYVRDFVTRLGTLRLRVARSRGDVQTETFFSRDSAHLNWSANRSFR
jgi:hypothetical protein